MAINRIWNVHLADPTMVFDFVKGFTIVSGEPLISNDTHWPELSNQERTSNMVCKEHSGAAFDYSFGIVSRAPWWLERSTLAPFHVAIRDDRLVIRPTIFENRNFIFHADEGPFRQVGNDQLISLNQRRPERGGSHQSLSFGKPTCIQLKARVEVKAGDERKAAERTRFGITRVAKDRRRLLITIRVPKIRKSNLLK